MKPALVADVGNSRIKWGRCVDGRLTDCVSLPPDDRDQWQHQLANWHRTEPLIWAVCGVHPKRRDELVAWLRRRGNHVEVLEAAHLPLHVRLEHPERVGIDRLLNAVAVNSRRPPGVPAVLIDAGSAVTVDWIDGDGAFCGGAIFPGIRLMAKALREYTALLPLVEVTEPLPSLPATSTTAAIEAGIYWAVAGGIRSVAAQLTAGASADCRVWLAGGDAALLAPALPADVIVWPDMTLEGIRLAADPLP
jgi:type III pantothenate kinase